MSEWQPAICIKLMPSHVNINRTIKPLLVEYRSQGILIRVRPSAHVPYYFTCGAERAFEVHPDDVMKYKGYRDIEIVCEHQILTD